ncbi:ester cyclase [Spirillospora sp. CA-294931]|uniref:ester cyclase n=1 Tax=Spirillospora sp. CA-294931 TaxID=3240042 RepID=UPI003D938D53
MATARTDDNKALLDRLHEATNSGDLELITKTIDEVVEPDVLFHTAAPVDATGAEALKQVWAMLLRAFPDIHVTYEDVIAEDDKVVCRNTVTGTHQGDYMGIPATDKKIKYNEIFIFRIVGGRFAEVWGVVDVASLMRQLGASPH